MVSGADAPGMIDAPAPASLNPSAPRRSTSEMAPSDVVIFTLALTLMGRSSGIGAPAGPVAVCKEVVAPALPTTVMVVPTGGLLADDLQRTGDGLEACSSEPRRWRCAHCRSPWRRCRPPDRQSTGCR